MKGKKKSKKNKELKKKWILREDKGTKAYQMGQGIGSAKRHCSSALAGVGSNSHPPLSAKRNTEIATFQFHTLSLSSLCHLYKLIWLVSDQGVEPPKGNFLTSEHIVTNTYGILQ